MAYPKVETVIFVPKEKANQFAKENSRAWLLQNLRNNNFIEPVSKVTKMSISFTMLHMCVCVLRGPLALFLLRNEVFLG